MTPVNLVSALRTLRIMRGAFIAGTILGCTFGVVLFLNWQETRYPIIGPVLIIGSCGLGFRAYRVQRFVAAAIAGHSMSIDGDALVVDEMPKLGRLTLDSGARSRMLETAVANARAVITDADKDTSVN